MKPLDVIYLQVDPEGDRPEVWPLEGITWSEDRMNDNDVRFERGNRIEELKAEKTKLREAAEAVLHEAGFYPWNREKVLAEIMELKQALKG